MPSPRTTFIPAMLLILVSIAGMYVFVPASEALEPDSFLVPLWARFQDAPEVRVGDGSLSDGSRSGIANCLSLFSLQMDQDVFASYFDSATSRWHLFVSDGDNNQVILHKIDAQLNHDSTPLPLPSGLIWAAADLDLDGNVEIVHQHGSPEGSILRIYSAPSWTERYKAVFVGMNVFFHAVAANIDTDPHLEVVCTPNNLGGVARLAIVQYDAVLDSFMVTDYIPAPTGTSGHPAVGDLDNDGLTEIIVGNDEGYDLFEYNGTVATHVGPVGTQRGGNNFHAITARPFPGASPCAVTGHSASADGYIYEFLQATGDNSFDVSQVFQEMTGWFGTHRSYGTDVDCDGLEEVILTFYPTFKVLEWNTQVDSFVTTCQWDADVFGSFVHYQEVDLNQDGVPEWGTMNHDELFQAFAQEFCAEPRETLIAWWPLDEATTPVSTDVWGENDGVWIGDPIPVAGQVAGCLLLDGTDDNVQVADTDSLDFGTSDLSIEAWINTTTTSSANPILSKFDNANDLGWALWIADGNSLRFSLADGLTSIYASDTAGGIADGAWHHVAITVDRDDVNGLGFYLDSAPIGTANPTDRPSSVSNDVALMLGAWSSTPGDTAFFDGMLDEVSVYSRALDSAEIRCIFLADSRGKCQPDTSCNCPSQGDLEPDGFLTAIDLAGTIDALFAGGENPQDIYCPTFRFDIDCDEFTTALDLSILIDHLFAGGNGPCEPCGP